VIVTQNLARKLLPAVWPVKASATAEGRWTEHPRAVSNLALQAMVAVFATGKDLVDEAAARAAVSEVIGN